jgi:hypothetical protein
MNTLAIAMAYILKKFAKTVANTYQKISFSEKCKENNFRSTKLKRQQQLKPAWLSLLKARMAMSKDQSTFVI